MKLNSFYEILYSSMFQQFLKNIIILIHNYMDVDIHIMWNIMIGDIPELNEKIKKMLA